MAATRAEALRRTDDDRRRRSERELRPAIAIGLIAAPGLAADLADGVASDLEAGLAELYPDAEWHVPVVIDGLVRPPATTIELIDATHERLMLEDWELALCLTDLPLRIGRRAVVGHASPTDRVALLSVPALGPARLRRRAVATAIDLLNVLLGESGGPPTEGRASGRRSDRLRRRLVELSVLADEDPAHGPTGPAALAGGGRLRLLGAWSARIGPGGWPPACTGR